MLNRAKFLYSLVEEAAFNQFAKDAAWAQAVLFAELLNWKEFEEIRQFVDSEIQKVYPKYQTLTSKTTAEIVSMDKNLAAAKYFVDKELKISDSEIKQKQPDIRDEYLKASIVAATNMATDKELQELEQALAKKDPLVTKKFVQSTTTAGILKWLIFAVGMLVLGGIIVVFKKKRRK